MNWYGATRFICVGGEESGAMWASPPTRKVVKEYNLIVLTPNTNDLCYKSTIKLYSADRK